MSKCGCLVFNQLDVKLIMKIWNEDLRTYHGKRSPRIQKGNVASLKLSSWMELIIVTAKFKKILTKIFLIKCVVIWKMHSLLKEGPIL